ncbi:ankyrin repeat-containing domain protein [Annulohypoxylon maeteangense]|uniref:ankyrin repeat-containing domain protein n=1 Tax=Annulohypoxylon maeteangense TaxID=1927788 RepID=UPI002007284F|nr:ankyrin repeat-containing domain protein [Annulohypoxylon maeteangense]KAI0882253.1 ankyrin repeat-containing domain protein [Annulohypoxylon maeteangense]
MKLLDLPVEIFHNILFFAVLSRGLVRALRLKLVCRQFYHAIGPVLFRTQLPVHVLRSSHSVAIWRTCNRHGAEKFWHDYVSYRVRCETDPNVGRCFEMRRVVEEYCVRTGGDFDSTLDSLCWAVFDRVFAIDEPDSPDLSNSFNEPDPLDSLDEPGLPDSANEPDLSNSSDEPDLPDSANEPDLSSSDDEPDSYSYSSDSSDEIKPEYQNESPNIDYDILSAAAHLGDLKVAEQLINEGLCPLIRTALFKEPVFYAAFAGHPEMLKLFHKHTFTCRSTRSYGFFNLAIEGANERGDMGIIRLLVSLYGQTVPDRLSGPGRYINFWSFPMHDHADLFKLEGYFIRQHKSNLLENAKLGNLNAVRDILHLSRYSGDQDIWRQRRSPVPWNEYYFHSTSAIDKDRAYIGPLMEAVSRGHEKIVELLLDHGIDPNFYTKHDTYRDFRSPEYKSPLVVAAARGSFAIMRKLLDYDADITKFYYRIAGLTLLQEHTAMLKFVLKKGGYSKQLKARLKGLALKEGLESMAEVAEQIESDSSLDDYSDDDRAGGFWEILP